MSLNDRVKELERTAARLPVRAERVQRDTLRIMTDPEASRLGRLLARRLAELYPNGVPQFWTDDDDAEALRLGDELARRLAQLQDADR